MHKGRTIVPIDYEKRNSVAYITLNNPEKANILDKPTSDDISAAWIDLWEDKDIRCAIVTGKGDKHFCGGHNLTPRPDLTEEDREFLRLQKVYWPLAGTVHGQTTGVDGRMGDHYPRVWKPVIAAVNGWAAGAGLYLLLSSTDIRIASAEHARFKFALLTQGWRVPFLKRFRPDYRVMAAIGVCPGRVWMWPTCCFRVGPKSHTT